MPTVTILVTYDVEIEDIATTIVTLLGQQLSKQEVHRLLNPEAMMVPIRPGAHHATAVDEALAALPAEPAPDKRLVIACFADGMAEEGREEYRTLQVWCKERSVLLQVVNGKNGHHHTTLCQTDTEQSHLIQTIIGKLDGVKRERKKAEGLTPRSDEDSPKEPQPGGRVKIREPEEPEEDEDDDSASPPAPPAAEDTDAPRAAGDAPTGLFGPGQASAPQHEVAGVDEYDWDLAEQPEGTYNRLVAYVAHRILEGQGECILKVGVDSKGRPKGLAPAAYEANLGTIRRIAADLHAAVSIVVEKTTKEGLMVSEVLVRKAEEEDYIDMRIAICGNVDSGKSTFVGVLTKGLLDNGRGLVRQQVFRHKHEADTGRTSSISEQLIGFDATGNVVNYAELRRAEENAQVRHQITGKEISEKSAKIITFYDLAGHEKYLKTTVLGMTGSMPDYACIVISANNGIQRMTKEHLGLCLALKIPFFVVITRVDMCPAVVAKNTTDNVVKILRQPTVHKLPYMVRTPDDVVICAKNIKEDRIAPVFHVSNVTGENLELVRRFLNLVPVRKDWNELSKNPLEAIIDSTFYVAGVGTVVGGIIMAGSVRPNDTVLLGPNSNGHFRQAVIKSIHVKQVNVNKADAGTAACFALKKERRSDIRKGMVLLDARSKPQATWEFEAEVVVLFHHTLIQNNYQPVVHCGTVRQSCALVLSEQDMLRTGDKAKVRFRFMYKPEYIKLGARLIFREGRTKGVGTVCNVFYPTPTPQ